MRVAKSLGLITLAAGATLMLTHCGGGSSSVTPNASTTEGALIYNPPLRVASITAADFTASLQAAAAGPAGSANTANAQGLLALLTGAGLMPACGVDVNYIQYHTVGGAGEATTASGVVMVPTGTSAQCSGARPIVLHAHGTTIVRTYNLAAINDPTNDAYFEATWLMAMYAAQGYIVVAPNYAGYDSSTLSYHPYLNADQESTEMIDALHAAQGIFGHIAATTTPSGVLFLSGNSEGGHVAVATLRKMQAMNPPIPVVATAAMSGPYALASFADAIMFGSVNLGSTAYIPLVLSSYQNSYPTTPLYTTPSELYAAPYSGWVGTLLPGADFTTLVTQGKLPQTALFSNATPTDLATACGANAYSALLGGLWSSISPPTLPSAEAPLFALGFGASGLITNSYREGFLCDALINPDGIVPGTIFAGTPYAASYPVTGMPATSPQNQLRKDAKANDLRDFVPTSNVLLCGGNADPSVYYALNTGTMEAFWSAGGASSLLTVLDVDTASPMVTDAFYALEVAFGQAKLAVETAAVQQGVDPALAVAVYYHGTLVPPFCGAAHSLYFSNILAHLP